MYDAIVVGARCAGAPTAMLLARAGRRVLLLDKAQRGTDTLSTHYIHQSGVKRLADWGLLERLEATGCPPIREYTFDVGPFALTGSPPPLGDIDAAYSPRRYVLDRLLVEAAEEAGVEVRHGVQVQGLETENGRVIGAAGERADMVVGADGRNSIVARAAGARLYDVRPTLTCAYYTYWTGVELDGVELYPRAGRMIGASPTHDGRVMTIVLFPQAEFQAVRADIETAFLDAVALAPSLDERLRRGARAERFRGTRLLPNHYREATGPGWALAGDAGCHKDPILALGITDAFRDADLLAQAILEDDLEGYGPRRDELSKPGFESTIQFAALQPPPMEMLEPLRGDQAATDRFFGVFAGTVELSEAGR
jgi:2-polyprenyl-6-methoxyphenol hydroxylase-like FAD-dependent oxidoreductase